MHAYQVLPGWSNLAVGKLLPRPRCSYLDARTCTNYIRTLNSGIEFVPSMHKLPAVYRTKDIPVNATHRSEDIWLGATDIPLLRQIKAKYRSQLQEMQVFLYEGHTTVVLAAVVKK